MQAILDSYYDPYEVSSHIRERYFDKEQDTSCALHPSLCPAVKGIESHPCCPVQALVTSSKLPADIRQILLNPEHSKKAGAVVTLQSCTLPRRLQEALVTKYNVPQQNAVAGCLTGHNRFTLVQVCPKITFNPRTHLETCLL